MVSKKLLMFGPLPVRILAGITFIAHGLPKFENIAGTQDFFGSIGLPPELALPIGLLEVQAGVNDVSSISFSLSDEKSELIKNDLLKQAVANTKSKADIAASALGLKVIGVKSINVEALGGFPPSPEPLFAREAMSGAVPPSAPPTPIIAGEQQHPSSL
jgi:hypothetical protein